MVGHWVAQKLTISCNWTTKVRDLKKCFLSCEIWCSWNFGKGLFINYVSGLRGGVWVWKLLTMAQEEGRGGKANSENG